LFSYESGKAKVIIPSCKRKKEKKVFRKKIEKTIDNQKKIPIIRAYAKQNFFGGWLPCDENTK
jgi:hypothetical protein